jgi:hypothetical protein
MASHDKNTKVRVDSSVRFGEFANAFRVVEEVGPDVFLDFMVYSASEEEATVVSRVRVRRDFLPRIRSTLSEAMTEFKGAEGSALAENSIYRKNGETVH